MTIPSEPITLWLVEDNDSFRRSLARALEKTGGFQCSGSFSNCENALAACRDRSAPQVILLDVGLPGMDGIAGLRLFRQSMPSTLLIILTVFEDDDKIFRAICAGASGYLLKTAPVRDIAAAIRDTLEGGSPMNSRVARRVLAMFSSFAPEQKDYGLTAREKEILQFMVAGHIKKEIADRMSLSVHTVNTHMRHIYEKLHVTTGTGAVAKALQERLL
ncbi:MAG TPA: response regulator transcription factor [Verrucomicrobiales bacterium]|jgi:DNA-binding NarL/FixJ family response regulator|nr:response regulator transcription factor [Verrucomicrobiales bacterium]